MKERFLNGFIKRAARVAHIYDSFESLPKRLMAGYKNQTGDVGGMGGSMIMLPTRWGASLIGKKHKFSKAVHRLNRASLAVDTSLGKWPHRVMSKMPLGKELFVQKDMVPVGKGVHKEVKRTSVLAPAHKATSVAAPVIVGVTLDKQLRKLKKKENSENHGR